MSQSTATRYPSQQFDWSLMFDYIKSNWPTVVRHTPSNHKTLIGLPYRYVVPTSDNVGGFTYNEMFYWDSFFMSLGLRHYPELRQLVVEMTKNLAFLFEQFGVIPNGSRFYFTSRSQPPFFTQMILLSYRILLEDKDPDASSFLRKMMELAEQEHEEVWLGTSDNHIRLVYDGLSRYYDINVADALVVAESGWDQSNRCGFDRWRFHLPVCLNSILYRREMDMAETFDLLGESTRATGWRTAAEARKQTMNRLMWNKERRFFADYDYQRLQKNRDASLAMFYTLWAGLATPEQASDMVQHWLPKFEQKGGLVTTLKPQKDVQWAWPNGWAPLQMLIVAGLDAYGFTTEANRIRIKWLDMCAAALAETGKMWEKYDVVDGNHMSDGGLYGRLPGFGWTWAACDEFRHALLQNPATAV